MKTRSPSRFRWLLVAMALAWSLPARAVGPVPVTLYDQDPQHLWNRLYSALLTGNPDADPSATDLLDPPLWFGRFLREGPSNATAVALLREFVTSGPRPGSMSPIQRAVMQRDLLGVFHTFARPAINYHDATPAERELLTALSFAIRHVALTPEEITKLPDNYAAAVAVPGAVTEDNPAQPAPFLPKDLLAEGGPWIAVLPDSGVTATAHFRAFEGRSSFEVRLRHPEGRKAGIAYLNALADMKDPLVNDPPQGIRRAPSAHLRGTSIIGHGIEEGPWLNPKTPQFPVGTMWALVRRAVLAAPNGQPVPSPLVESVQVRIYRTLEAMNTVMESPEAKASISAAEESRRNEAWTSFYALKVQTMFEWETRHALLLNGGGFHLTQPDDLRFAVFPNGMLTAREIAKEPPRTAPVAGMCSGCHFGPGIHSVQSLTRRNMTDPQLARPPELYAVSRTDLDSVTSREALKKPGWILLRWLMTEPAH